MESSNGQERQRGVSPSQANVGIWSFHQNLAYAIFVDIHKKSMTSKRKMRAMDFFPKLSLFVSTRTDAQCRSHHQKIFTKFKYVSNITALFKTQLGKDNYNQLLQQGHDCIRRINALFAPKQPQPTLSPSPPSQDHLSPNATVPVASKPEQRPNDMSLESGVEARNWETKIEDNGGIFYISICESVLPWALTGYLL